MQSTSTSGSCASPMLPKSFAPFPFTQKLIPAALSHSGTGVMGRLEHPLIAPLHRLKPIGLPKLPLH